MTGSTKSLIGAVLIVLVGAALRFYDLGLKPLHHDEGVNHHFVSHFLIGEGYAYNPENFHGPLLYEIAFPVVALFGDDEAVLRSMPAVFGVAALAIVLFAAPLIGAAGALFAAAMLAVSSPDVYFSRTFIHEIYLAFFLVVVVVFLFRFLRDARLWDFRIAILAVVGAFAIKETAAIAVIGIALGYLAAWRFGSDSPSGVRFSNPFTRMNARPKRAIDAIGIALLVWMLLFTTVGTNPRGLADFFVAYIPWLKTGVGDTGHVKSALYFVKLVGRYYWPFLIAALPALVEIVRRRRSDTIFLAVFFVAQIAVYSAIPYKTPWCVLPIAVPLMLLAAIGVQTLWDLAKPQPITRLLVIAAAVTSFVGVALPSRHINFEKFDDDREPIVYVQTMRRYLDMFDIIEKAAKNDKGLETEILIVDYQSPTKYYLRAFRNTTYFASEPDTPVTAPIVIATKDYEEGTRAQLASAYSESRYPIWPGMELVLFVRADLLPDTQNDDGDASHG